MDRFHYKHTYYRGKSLLEWCLIWFKTYNDAFYEFYGFNFNPHEYPNLYELGRKILFGEE